MSDSQRNEEWDDGDEERQYNDQYQGYHEQGGQDPSSDRQPAYGSPPPFNPYPDLQDHHQYPPTAPAAAAPGLPPLEDANGASGSRTLPAEEPWPVDPALVSPAHPPPAPSVQPPPAPPSQPQASTGFGTRVPPYAELAIDYSTDWSSLPPGSWRSAPPGSQHGPSRHDYPLPAPPSSHTYGPPTSNHPFSSYPSQSTQHGYGLGANNHQDNDSTAPTANMGQPGSQPIIPPMQPGYLDPPIGRFDPQPGQSDTQAGVGKVPKRKRNDSTNSADQPGDGQENEAEMDADANQSKPKRRKKPIRPLQGRPVTNQIPEDQIKGGGGQWCADPKKSTRGSAATGLASASDQILYGASVHKDKHGNIKRGTEKHRGWVLPRKDALLEALGLFSNAGERHLNRHEIVDRQIRQTPNLSVDNDEETRNARKIAQNTWSKALTLALDEFWKKYKHMDQGQQTAKDNLIAERKSQKHSLDTWAPTGRLRLFLTPEELCERDQAFQAAQNAANTGATSVFTRFPQLDTPPANVNAPAAPAPTSASAGPATTRPAATGPAATGPAATGPAASSDVPQVQQPQSTSADQRTSPRLRPSNGTTTDPTGAAFGDDAPTTSASASAGRPNRASSADIAGTAQPDRSSQRLRRSRLYNSLMNLPSAALERQMEEHPLRRDDGQLIRDPAERCRRFADESEEAVAVVEDCTIEEEEAGS